jgi:thioredoxin reductase (NADPH)
MSETNQYEKLKQCKNIEVIYNTILEKICGDDYVKTVKIKNVNTGIVNQLNIDGVFIFIGMKPNNSFIMNDVINNFGYVIVNPISMSTKIPGIFACGDIKQNKIKQIITATADGAIAILNAKSYIDSLNI